MIGVSLLAAGALVVTLVAILAAVGVVRRNSVAGIRIPSLHRSESAWRVGHRAAVLPTAVAAVICIALAFVVLTIPGFALTASVLETVVLVIGVLVATTLASRAAREQNR